jgi:hypothetical protein
VFVVDTNETQLTTPLVSKSEPAEDLSTSCAPWPSFLNAALKRLSGFHIANPNIGDAAMLYAIDLRTNEPRSAHEKLGDVKLLARAIDKGRAALTGTLGRYIFFDCPLDRLFFDAVNVSRNEFLEILREAYTSQLSYNAAALADLRESLESKPEISDECFLAFAEARDADKAAVTWLLDQRRTPASVLAEINAAVDCLRPKDFIDWATDE